MILVSNLCRSTHYDAFCYCGSSSTYTENTMIRYRDDKWCCSNNCTVQETFDWIYKSLGNKIVSCYGETLNLNQQCQTGNTCNFYPDDKNRNFLSIRSYLDVCGNKRYDINISLEIFNLFWGCKIVDGQNMRNDMNSKVLGNK